MRARIRHIAPAYFFLLFTPLIAIAQPAELEPERWYPLKANNYWHYQTGDAFTDYVVKTEKDTLVAGERWMLFAEAYCGGPYCPIPSAWRRMTEDYYVIETRDFIRSDTLWRTTPRSIFTVNVPYDSTLQSPYAVEGSTNRPGYADVTVDTLRESEIYLHAALGFGAEVVCARFIYEIGYSGNCSSPGIDLRGAYVNDYLYGDSHLIPGLVSIEDEVISSLGSMQINVYPNPFSESLQVEVNVSDQGVYVLSVFDALGRNYAMETRYIASKEKWSRTFNAAELGSSGVYFISLRSPSGTNALDAVVFTK